MTDRLQELKEAAAYEEYKILLADNVLEAIVAFQGNSSEENRSKKQTAIQRLEVLELREAIEAGEFSDMPELWIQSTTAACTMYLESPTDENLANINKIRRSIQYARDKPKLKVIKDNATASRGQYRSIYNRYLDASHRVVNRITLSIAIFIALTIILFPYIDLVSLMILISIFTIIALYFIRADRLKKIRERQKQRFRRTK